ncbi:MAG: glycoside hydrolase family 127 protein [Bacteroidia bacterium]|nr:glycoside hydrolase family 127 protein [Bacteroidia bacterium]
MKAAILFSFCFLQLTFAVNAIGQKPIKPAKNDTLFPSQSALIKGYVGGKLDVSYQNRILAQDVNRLVEPFRNRTEDRCWQSEFWGKWFTSAVLAYRYRPEPQLKSLLDQAVSGLLSTQSPNGYIGNYAENKQLEQWDIWGRKYCMLGLLAYNDLTGDKNSLLATKKLADHLIKELADKNALIVKQGNHRGMAATSILEPICLLYSRTGDKRYLDFANEIVRQWESPDGPQLISKSGIDVAKRFPKPKNWFSWDQGQKAYEMMSCYEGLLELYRLTGKPEYREAVEKTWQNILDTEINIAGSGSGVECWFGGKQLQTMHIDHYQETCVTATWIKLSQQLLRLTGEAKYADAIEQTYYNALLGAMYSDGSDWAKYSPLAGQRLQGSEQCGMGLNCCVASGPRGLFTLPLTAVMSKIDGISVNFFVEGSYRLLTPGGKPLEVIQQTNYPVSGNISLKIVVPKEEQFKVRIRIPLWSQRTMLTINDQPVETVIPGKYAEISRVWKSGDFISLTLDMRGRVIRIGDMPENLAIVRGPIVLARDARLGTPHVDETIKPIIDKEGFVNLESAGTNQNGIWMKYKGSFMVESHQEGVNKPVEITLCDYASAGNTLDEHSWFRVWLPQSYDPRK